MEVLHGIVFAFMAAALWLAAEWLNGPGRWRLIGEVIAPFCIAATALAAMVITGSPRNVTDTAEILGVLVCCCASLAYHLRYRSITPLVIMAAVAAIVSLEVWERSKPLTPYSTQSRKS